MPPVSEAQRRLMYSAAAHRGGAGGVPQAVAEEFTEADKPGKLPARKKSPSMAKHYGKKRVRRGFDEGGQVGVNDLTETQAAFVKERIDAQREKEAQAADKVRSNESHAKGGPVRKTSGKPIGKDDGMISAQRGEFVIKKSAAKKLGTTVLNEVNKGHIPSRHIHGRSSHRG